MFKIKVNFRAAAPLFLVFRTVTPRAAARLIVAVTFRFFVKLRQRAARRGKPLRRAAVQVATGRVWRGVRTAAGTVRIGRVGLWSRSAARPALRGRIRIYAGVWYEDFLLASGNANM